MKTRRFFFPIILVILMSCSFANLKAQKFEIITKSVNLVDNKLVVDYGFSKYKKKQLFRVRLVIQNSEGDKLNVKTITGDVGENIFGGENKQITWDFMADNIVIDDDIGIEVKAELIGREQGTISVGKALVLSSVVPGLGIAKVKQKKSFLLFTTVTYGSIFVSYLSNKNANDNYQKYLNEYIISSESDYYSKSKSQLSMSNTFKYTAIATWAVNMVWTAVSASKNKKSTNNVSYNSKLKVNTTYDYFAKTPVFVLSLTF